MPPGEGGWAWPSSREERARGLVPTKGGACADPRRAPAPRPTAAPRARNTDHSHDYHVSRGDRVAQLVIQRVEEVAWTVVEELQGIDRGGGFGHSGR